MQGSLDHLQIGPVGWVLLACAAVGAVDAATSVVRWRRGRPDGPLRWRDLLSVPRRYFHDVHDVVMRDRASARMHMAAAGGATVLLGLLVLVHLLGVRAAWASWMVLAAASVTLVGAGMDILRRSGPTRRRLSGGLYPWLPAALAALAIFGAAATASLAGIGEPVGWQGLTGAFLLALGFASAGFLIAGVARGPMRHAFAGVLHLAFHERPERFRPGETATALLPLNLEDEVLGANAAKNFRWRQILSFDACIQCGRCEEACPAFAAGAPLNPKKLIFDLLAANHGLSDGAYAGHRHPGIPPAQACSTGDPLIGEGGRILPDTLWACTTCRACVEACPMLIEHVDAVIDLRRFQTLEAGDTPGKGPTVLESLAETDTVSGRATTARLDWARDLKLPLARERLTFDVLLWLGESALEPRGQRILRALIGLLRAAGVDFAVLGDEELDTGDLARRLGDEALFQSLASRNIEVLAKYRFDQIVTNDPHVLHVLKNEYPALGGRFTVLHHTTFLGALLEAGALALNGQPGAEVTYHDPCYLGRYNKEFDSPRAILHRAGAQLREMPRHRANSFCCGWGGGAAYTDVPAEHRIPDLRMAEARSTSTRVVATACPNCAVMLESAAEAGMEIKDIAELLVAAEGTAP